MDGDKNKVSIGIKATRQVNQYEPVSVDVYFTAILPDETAFADFAATQATLYQMGIDQLVSDLDDAVTRMQAARAVNTAIDHARDESVPGQQPAGFPKPPVKEDVVGHLDPAQQLQQAPDADKRMPGTWWRDVADGYELTADKLSLFKDNLDFPIAYLTSKSKAWPSEAWLNHMIRDGSKQLFGKKVEVIQLVADKKNSKGNFYANVVSLRALG